MKAKHLIIIGLILVILLPATETFGQVSGNIAYDKSRNQGYKSSGSAHKVWLSDSAMLIEARVLLNAKADEYVAVFGLSEEGKTILEANNKLDKRINEFIVGLKKLNVGPNDYYVDFITQSRIYDYETSGNNATEKLVGFEVKKNISIHYNDKDLITKLAKTASEFEIFDLIMVDYIITNIDRIKDQLFTEAIKIINSKKEKYSSVNLIKILPQSQVFYEDFAKFSPSDLYDSYTAYESGQAYSNYYQKNLVVNQRKMKTFYFKPIDESGFDRVINPVIIEPVVQYAYTLQIKYQINLK